MPEAVTSNERLIVALDYSSKQQALELVEKLEGLVSFFKIGLELFSATDSFKLIDILVNRNCRVFADFKFFDIPQTVYRAVRTLNGRGIEFTTVHAQRQTMQAAVDAAEDVGVLGVTVLTSMDNEDLKAFGHSTTVDDLVEQRAIDADELGRAGVVASPKEITLVRKSTRRQFLIVTPGIRSNDAPFDDQKRTVTFAEAVNRGADYCVVGRAIRDADNPVQAVEKILASASTVLG